MNNQKKYVSELARQLSEDHLSPITRETFKVKEVKVGKEVNFKDSVVKMVKRRSSLDASLVRYKVIYISSRWLKVS